MCPHRGLLVQRRARRGQPQALNLTQTLAPSPNPSPSPTPSPSPGPNPVSVLEQGVTRAHLVPPVGGALLKELYTLDGIGTLLSRLTLTLTL